MAKDLGRTFISNNTMEEIQQLLKQDIAEFGKKSYQPKILFRGGKLTKKADAFNRKLIREGKTSVYLNPNKLYNLQTKSFINKPIDRRSGKIKQSFLKNNIVFNGVVAPKKDTFNFRFVGGDGSLLSNKLLQKLIQQNNITGNYRLVVTRDGNTIADGNFNFPLDDFSRFRATDTDRMIWNEGLSAGEVVNFVFTKEKLLPQKYYQQKFREGVNNCVIKPVMQWAESKRDSSKTKSTMKRWNAMINKLKKDEIEYAEGFSIEDLKVFVEKYKISITLSQPFSNNHETIEPSNGGMKKFKFINTRLDHVDCGDFGLDRYNLYKTYDPEIVTKEELLDIKKKCDETGELCIYNKNAFGIHRLRTLQNYYTLGNEFNNAVKDFEKKYKLLDCAFDTLKHPNLSKFINAGTHFAGTVDWYDTRKYKYNIPDYVKHIDMKAAYTNCHLSRYFKGFMGKITDFRKVKHYKYNGLYYIENLSLLYADKKFKKYNKILNWFVDKNVYTNAELECLASYGGKFDVVYGCYGIDKEFEFTEEMKNGEEIVDFANKDIRIKFYAKWCGLNCCENDKISFYIQGDKRYLQSLDTQAQLWCAEDEVRVQFDNDTVFTKKHLTTQIIAYQRLIMLDQLMKMDYDSIIRVCVDGIYYKEHEFEIINPFRPKHDKMTFGNDPCEGYLSGLIEKGEIDFVCEGDYREHYKSEVYVGEGGVGKTYNVLTDKGFIDVVYAPHSEKLASSKRKEFGVQVSNHARLLSYKCGVEKRELYKFGVIVIDEASMLNRDDIKYILEGTASKIIVLGDFEGQLKPVTGKMMTFDGFDNVNDSLKKNYRFKDDRIRALAYFVRGLTEKCRMIIPDEIDMKKIGLDEVKHHYDYKNDIILVSRGAKRNKTSNLNDYWCNEFLEKKYKVETNFTRDGVRYNTGDIVFEDIGNCELRHGFTVHSVQGETFRGKIFIDMRYLDDTRMLYTALSRANYWEQLYMVI